MTTARRRKASNRSVAIRRVKSRKSQNAKRLKTFRRKTRNVVMRGGANDIKLYYEPAISPPRCIIIKEGVRGRRDPLYLFFAMDITPNEINDYVRSAMGLESATFEPQFIEKPNENTDLKLNDLFVKLGSMSDMFSYSSINSGYLQRTKEKENEKPVASNTHKVSSLPKITKWEQILDNLKQKDHEFIEYKPFSENYTHISRYVAENGYSWVMSKQGWVKEANIRAQEYKCDKQIGPVNINMKNSINAAIERLHNLPVIIKEAAVRSVRENTDRETFITQINNHIKNTNQNFNYDTTIREITGLFESLKTHVNYDTLPDVCKRRFDERYDKSEYRTIEELYDDAVSARQSD